ncbi:MAG: hypothetical protein PHR39_08645 [Actinomycetota bacterium]|nr:hypothetical protein [Actinomycetota bacterium]
MAYTSDLRIKNYIKEVDIQARKALEVFGLESDLCLRIFDESDEDAKLWEDNGLSFTDPNTKQSLGSNDAGWFIKNTPIVIVEGTYGTERGQFGDGQLNRMSHSLGVALNGYVGVTLVPYKGQSFVKKGVRKDIKSQNINYQNAFLHKGMATTALTFSKHNKGKFLIIDPYDKDILKDLVINSVLDYYKKENNLTVCIEDNIKNIENYLGKSIYGSRSKQTIQNLYDVDENLIKCRARFYTQNIAALTTSTKRDGHGLLGKNLIELHSSTEQLFSIFVRLTQSDIATLTSKKSKEFQYLLNNPRIKIICFNDLVFTDDETKQKVQEFKNKNLHQTSEKKLIEDIQAAFNAGRIRINL